MAEGVSPRCACGAAASVSHPLTGPQCVQCATLRKQLEEMADAAEADDQQRLRENIAAAKLEQAEAERRALDVSKQ